MTARPRPIVSTFDTRASHALTCKQLGVVTVKAGGKLESWFL